MGALAMVESGNARARNDAPSEHIEENDTLAALHYLQQALGIAAYLPGGEHHGSIMADYVPSEAESAGLIRADIARAIMALERALA